MSIVDGDDEDLIGNEKNALLGEAHLPTSPEDHVPRTVESPSAVYPAAQR